MNTKLTESQIAKAKVMRDAGKTIMAIARELDVAADTVRRAIIPGFAQRRAAMNATARYRRERDDMFREAADARNAAGLRYSVQRKRVCTDELEQRFSEVPKHDTRNLTGRLFGDPLPGRSALDRMEQSQ